VLWVALAVALITFPWPQVPGAERSLAWVAVHAVSAVVAIAATARKVPRAPGLAWAVASGVYDVALVGPYARWVSQPADVWALGIPVLMVFGLGVNATAGAVLAARGVRAPAASR
jgi:hypothetical protein